MIKLSVLDKANILRLAALYDLWHASNKGRNREGKVSFHRDQEILLQYGFEYGMSRDSMFGLDKDGVTWQITAIPREVPSSSKGELMVTTWYRVDERGLRHKVLPSLTWEKFHTMFKKRK